jgi:addiction module RelE/StbE family toxin
MQDSAIDFSKNFLKQFRKLPRSQQNRFYERLTIFRTNPFDSRLRNHALHGKYTGYHSIDIAGDLRALYRKNGDRVVIFAFIGSHSQLY